MELISPEFIYYGLNSTNKINEILKGLKVKKSYVLCDPVLEELGLTSSVKEVLQKNNVEILLSTNVMSEPSVEKGNEVVDEVRSFLPDLIIGLGGGSTIDLAKAASVVALQEGKIENYLNLTGDMDLKNKKIPNILMPSTSGTSSEITDIAVFSTGESKDAITNKLMIADYAIIDPIYTYSLPPKVAAASGIDAFTHALEAFTSVNASPITDNLAKNAIEKIYNNLREAVWDKNNLDAKNEVSTGSIMAGISFYNAGVAGVHALAYPLGGNFNIPHGESNAVLLAYVYNVIQVACSRKLSELAPIFNIKVEGKSSIEISKEIIKKIYQLVIDVGMPSKLSYYGIEKSDIKLLTQNALKQTRLLARSPLSLTEEFIEKIYTDALKGNIFN